MKTSAILSVGVLLAAPTWASVMATKPQMKEYKNMKDCQNYNSPMHQSYPMKGQCYNMDDQCGAFNYGGGMHMYYEHGCKGQEHNPPQQGGCCEKGKYKSYKMGGGNRKKVRGEEEEKKCKDEYGRYEKCKKKDKGYYEE